MIGVIERVIENWLTSSNERSYQIPFCQLLAAEGETVIYISPHGPFEQGKDVITLDRRGRARAYQLKNGDIGLAEWRKYKGEVDELVELPIKHPAVHSGSSHLPIFVTNGEIKDTVVSAINSSNEAWRKRKYVPLRTVSKGELLKRFIAANGSYLPQELTDFTTFMELLVRDGKEPLDHKSLSSLLESVLRLREQAALKKAAARRALASSVLVSAYVLGHSYSSQNHWAVFEGWMLCASYVLATATRVDLVDDEWTISFDLCQFAALNALADLARECVDRKHFVEGHPLFDGPVYRARMTILVGLMSGWSLYHRIIGEQLDQEGPVRDFIKNGVKGASVWGESAIPFFVAAALEMEQQGNQLAAESLVGDLMRGILDINGRRDGRQGLPSPYYSVEQALRASLGLAPPFNEEFIGEAYTVHPLIDFLVRRWRRQLLKPMWYAITGTALVAFHPAQNWEWFRWRAAEGNLQSKFVGSPQSWAALIRDTDLVGVSVLPERFCERPGFAVLFALVYPHRFTRELLKLLEGALAQKT
jgi:hypothetical protein